MFVYLTKSDTLSKLYSGQYVYVINMYILIPFSSKLVSKIYELDILSLDSMANYLKDYTLDTDYQILKDPNGGLPTGFTEGIDYSLVGDYLTTLVNSTDKLEKLNAIASVSDFTETELRLFPETLATLILKYTTFGTTADLTGTNLIYYNVLNWMKGMFTDKTSEILSGISGTSTSSCGCSSSTTSTTVTSTCNVLDAYTQYNQTQMKAMFGDLSVFIPQWLETTNSNSIIVPNETLLINIKNLINALLDSGMSLVFNNTNTWSCPDSTALQAIEEKNKEILKNYLTVISYIENGTTSANKNYISYWGKAFAEFMLLF